MKKILPGALLAALLVAAPIEAQVTPAPLANGSHPEQHAPPGVTLPVRTPEAGEGRVVVTARQRYRRRVPRWRTTARHSRRCKQRYRTYNPRTNRYVARSGVRRVCVL